MNTLIDTILFLDVLRCRVNWPRLGALAFATGIWAVLGVLLGRAV